MPKVRNDSQASWEVIVSKSGEPMETVPLRPGQTDDIDINLDDVNMRAAIFVGALVVEGEEPRSFELDPEDGTGRTAREVTLPTEERPKAASKKRGGRR